MTQSIRTQRIARLIQKELGEIFIQETSRLLDNTMVTVTEVQMSPDLGIAKIYLSFILNKENGDMLAKIKQQKGALKKILGIRIGKHLCKVPDLRFYTDNSAAHAAKMHQLLDELDISENMDVISSDEWML